MISLKDSLLIIRLLAAVLLLSASSIATAQTLPESSLPDALSDWRNWVLQDSDRSCPIGVRVEQRICSFSGAVSLEFEAQSGRFSQRAQVYKTALIALPGDADSLWPLSVTVDGRAAAVLQRGNRPVLELEPGQHVISGSFRYERLPERISVPFTSSVSLRVLGQAIDAPERSGDELYLGQSVNAAPAANALDVEVHRLLTDSYPMLLETVMTLTVSGEGRSALLGPALPANFLPTGIDSDLRAELKPDGMLSVQLKPGKWRLSVYARATDNVEKIEGLPTSGGWPEEETLSFVASPELRTIALLGLNSIDPTQANVPSEWHAYPSYLWPTGTPLQLSVESRGRDPAESNRLRVERELWLDFSGQGFSARDQISGSMVKTWRIDLRQPYRMTRAETRNSDGELEALLVSKPKPELTGVEVRSPMLQLASSARLETPRAFPISGLAEAVESVSLKLYTPPGWTLFAVSGASRADSTWLSRWHVYALFAVALLSFGSAWLFGKKLALAMAAFLTLSWFDLDILPYQIFVLLVLAALARWCKPGWKQRLLRSSAIIVWLFAAVSALLLMQQQIKLALFPQLAYQNAYSESRYDNEASGFGDSIAPQAAMAPPPPPQKAMEEIAQEQSQTLDSVVVAGSRLQKNMSNNMVSQKRRQLARYASNSVIQAGVAEPDWRFIAHHVSFDGPITPEQGTRFWLLGPKTTGAIRLLSAILLGYILFRLAFAGPHRAQPSKGGRPLWWQSWSAMSLLMLASHGNAQNTPAPEILEELKARLQRSELCVEAQACINLNEARVQIVDGTLSLEAMAQAGARTLVVLPFPERALGAGRFSIDGETREPVLRNAQSVYFVLERGVHVLRMEATLRESNLTLNFELNPNRVEARAQGFEISGVRDGRLSASSLEFSKTADAASPENARSGGEFPPYVRVIRQVRLDLDWQIVTTVRRLSEYDGGISIKLPLIVGEQPIDPRIEIKDGHALIPIARGESEVEFTSNLTRSDTLSLTAPALAERNEVWSIEASPTWSLAFDNGVPQSLFPLSVDVDSGSGSDVQLRFDPLPGETLTVRVTRPDAAPGPAYRIDKVELLTRVGERASDSTLTLQIKATQGGRHAIALPANAELMQVTRDGTAFNLRLKQGLLELPLVPGANSFEVTFREAKALGISVKTPAIDLKMPSANIDLRVDWPAQRWLLWTHGPDLGAAVMIWPAILIALALAFVLVRSQLLALGFASLSLLLLALLNLNSYAAITVLLCFMALHWRMREGAKLRNALHWPSQLALVALCGVAFLMIVIAGLHGLLSPIDMQVDGYGSSDRALRWFADQSDAALPVASAFGIPMWCYRALSLAWALWLAYALIGWLHYAKTALSEGGFWRDGLWPSIKRYLRRRPEALAESAPDQTGPKQS